MQERGFESCRKLSKEYGATTGTSLHEYTNLLEYDFGTTDGFKKRLLKWENQIVDFQKATGEVFSDRLKCAIVSSRSPAPIRRYLRVQNRRDYKALRVALMNYLEAEDDGHGPVPTKSEQRRARKETEARRAMAKENLAKIWESTTEARNTARGTRSATAVRKEEKEQRKAKEKDKDEKPAANSSFLGYCRTCGKWRHKASECWQGYVQAVEDVPSSSASSVAPSAATTPAAAKTVALIQEFNVEQGPG